MHLGAAASADQTRRCNYALSHRLYRIEVDDDNDDDAYDDEHDDDDDDEYNDDDDDDNDIDNDLDSDDNAYGDKGDNDN